MTNSLATLPPPSTSAQGWASQQTTLLDILARPKPTWLIEGFIPQGSICFVVGLPASAKSFLVQSWAASVATGCTWMNREVQQGVVAYMALEGNPRGIADRFYAWQEETGENINPLNLPLLLEFDPKNPGNIENLKAGLASGVSLVIIDTLAVFAGNTNLSNQSEVAAIQEFARLVIQESKGLASVIIVAHSTKADDSGIAGSVQLNAMADVIWRMEKNGNRYKASLYKNKIGIEGDSYAFELKQVTLGDEDISAVLVSTDNYDYSSTATRIDFEAVKKIFEDCDEWVPQSALIKEIIARQIRIHDSSARDLLKKATNLGLLEKVGTRTSSRFRITPITNNHEPR